MPSVFSAGIYFLWAVDAQESEEDGEMGLFWKILKHLNPLPMDKILLGQSLKR